MSTSLHLIMRGLVSKFSSKSCVELLHLGSSVWRPNLSFRTLTYSNIYSNGDLKGMSIRNLSSCGNKNFIALTSPSFISQVQAHQYRNLSTDHHAKSDTHCKYIDSIVLQLFGLLIGFGLGSLVKLYWDPRNLTSIYENESKSQFGFPKLSAASGWLNDDTKNDDSAEKQDSQNKKNFAKKVSPLRQQFNFIADIVEKVSPSVVSIQVEEISPYANVPGSASCGSGFVVSSDGYIITNAHVVMKRQKTRRVMVAFKDGKVLPARILRVNEQRDLAIIKVEAKDLPTISFGQSSDLRLGEFVIALGSPLALKNSVTTGVVSSTQRTSTEMGLHINEINYVQTDAIISNGSSGGPLINLDGEVIGINCLSLAAGYTFAVPSDDAVKFMDSFKKDKELAKSSPLNRRSVGVTLLSLTPDVINELRAKNKLPKDVESGVMLWRIALGSVAYHGGLKPGDVVTHVNGRAITTSSEFFDAVDKSNKVFMVIYRKDQRGAGVEIGYIEELPVDPHSVLKIADPRYTVDLQVEQVQVE